MGRTPKRTAGITAIAGPVVLLELPESPDPRPTRSRSECARREFSNWVDRRTDAAGELAARIQIVELRGADMSEPTVVFVHGAFADSSSWNGVITRLRAKGVPVIAPPNPLRGLTADSAYIASVFAQIEGPVVAVATPTAAR